MAFLSPSKWHTCNSKYTSTLRKQCCLQMDALCCDLQYFIVTSYASQDLCQLGIGGNRLGRGYLDGENVSTPQPRDWLVGKFVSYFLDNA